MVISEAFLRTVYSSGSEDLGHVHGNDVESTGCTLRQELQQHLKELQKTETEYITKTKDRGNRERSEEDEEREGTHLFEKVEEASNKTKIKSINYQSNQS